mgnify:FL=1
MRNNQNILTIIFIPLICYLLTSCSDNNYNNLIYSRWGIRLPFVLTNGSLVSKQMIFYGTISFKISDENKKELLMQDLGKYGYSKWSELHEGFIIGEINIMGKDFLVSTAKDEERLEYKKIFLNRSSNILIFVDYNWSGY